MASKPRLDWSKLPAGIIERLDTQVRRMTDTLQPSTTPIFISIEDFTVIRALLDDYISEYRGHPVRLRHRSSFGPSTAVREAMRPGPRP